MLRFKNNVKCLLQFSNDYFIKSQDYTCNPVKSQDKHKSDILIIDMEVLKTVS